MGSSSKGMSPCHSCSPVQPGTGSQPFDARADGNTAAAEVTVVALNVRENEVVAGVNPAALRFDQLVGVSWARSIFQRMAGHSEADSVAVYFRAIPAPSSGEPEIMGPWLVTTTSMASSRPDLLRTVSSCTSASCHWPLCRY